jgi:hypothetical protein
MTEKPGDCAKDYMADAPIARRAYEYWEQRGCPFGSSQVDWFHAVADIHREMTVASDTREDLKSE